MKPFGCWPVMGRCLLTLTANAGPLTNTNACIVCRLSDRPAKPRESRPDWFSGGHGLAACGRTPSVDGQQWHDDGTICLLATTCPPICVSGSHSPPGNRPQNLCGTDCFTVLSFATSVPPVKMTRRPMLDQSRC